MKRWLCLVLAGMLLLGCTACDGESDTSVDGSADVPPSTTSTATVATKTTTITTAKTTTNTTQSSSTSSVSTVRKANPATDFEYTIDKQNQVGIRRYIGEDTTVIIPEKIEGCPVIAILANAFTSANIELVDIPDTVTSIWSGAFRNCQNLHTVNMGDGVTHLLAQTFSYCKKLENLTLSANLEEIGHGAFEVCVSLEKVHIPKSVIGWGMEAFSGCPLTSLTFEEGIKKIGSYACFWGCKLTSITIPASVEEIGEYAFVKPLEKVFFLGDAPRKVGDHPFHEETVLYYKADTLGWENSSLGEEYTLLATDV